MLRRLANTSVKLSGICCVIRVGGELKGSRVTICFIASTPPVEAPIAMTFFTVLFVETKLMIFLSGLLLMAFRFAAAADLILLAKSSLSAPKFL